MQVDARRLDGTVPSLSLHGLECHPGFPQPGQAGVAQLVAGQMIDPSALTGSTDDLVETRAAQRMSSVRALQDEEDAVASRIGRPFHVEVAGEAGEEPRRDRHDPLVAPGRPVSK